SDVDKSYLEALIAAVDGKYEEERFTAESWAAFEEALTAAKDVVENDAATQEDVLSAYLDLVMARDSLTYAPDKSVLELAVDLANALLEDETLDLTDESIAALEEAIAAANLVIEDAEATQEDIDAAYEDVMYAIVSVMENEVDKEFLKSLIDQANNTIENHAGQYTASSIEALKEAAKAGQIVYDDPEADLEAVLDACKAITDANSALEERANLSNLEAAYNFAESLEGKYDLSSVEGLMNQAKEILANAADTPISEQEAAKELARKLTIELSKIRLNASIAAANEKLAEEEKYTEASVAAVKLALAEAEALQQIVEEQDVEAIELVEATAQKLDKAVDALKLVDDDKPVDPPKPSKPNKGSTSQV
ncbi:hypothetical protein, partial [Ligaoa zhengdingensis]|uniref:hypothetical protein n=1 Tax=Ligaoa zhengdingensis TaxID=2763658 RepID=UPI0031BABB73